MLAGRYHVAAKVPSLGPLLDAEAGTFALSRFDHREAQAYLESRGIGDETLRQVIVEKVREPEEKGIQAGCNPFKLALLADLVLGKEGITADEVRALPSADYQYLLERVIKRIPEQPLRWIVRYGVIPRRLTLDYVDQVLLDPLRRVLRGEPVGDAPRELAGLPDDVKRVAEQDLWVPQPSAEVSAEALWDDLLRYESGRGWISHVGGSAAYKGAVQFHGDIIDPMRDLLSYQQIFTRLQLDSTRYFEALATHARNEHDRERDGRKLGEHSERWTEWICEAVFHQFQAEDPDAEGFWRHCFSEPVVALRPDLRLKLARELLIHTAADLATYNVAHG